EETNNDNQLTAKSQSSHGHNRTSREGGVLSVAVIRWKRPQQNATGLKRRECHLTAGPTILPSNRDVDEMPCPMAGVHLRFLPGASALLRIAIHRLYRSAARESRSWRDRTQEGECNVPLTVNAEKEPPWKRGE